MKDKQDDLSLFFSELGSAGQIKPADGRGVDEKIERDMISKTSLHKYEPLNNKPLNKHCF